MERNKLSESCDHKWKTRSWSISYGISQTGYSLLAGQCNLCFMYVWIFEIVKLRLILPLYWLSFQFCLKNIAQQGILFGRSYISEEYLQNLKETVQSNNLSQSFVKIQCMHLKCWEKKNRHFKGALAFFFTGSTVCWNKNKRKMFCSLPAMTLRALNESHLVCAVHFRQRRSKSIQNGTLEKSV